MSTLQVEPKSKNIHLTLKNRDGSVEHYYHFLLGFLVPLALSQRDPLLRSQGLKFIRSCGILDRHVLDIGFEQIEIVDKHLHAAIAPHNRSKADICVHKFVKFEGYDDPAYYCQDSFQVAKSVLIEKLAGEIAAVTQNLANQAQKNSPQVVLIDREPPDSFYLSEDCEVDGAGKSRRSIANFSALLAAVRSYYPNTISTTLENKTLAYQIALFMHADIIIAQHGAALANVIWSDAGTTLIEVVPDDLPDCLREKNYFLNLAQCMDMNYCEVVQKGKHTNVDIDMVLSAMQR